MFFIKRYLRRKGVEAKEKMGEMKSSVSSYVSKAGIVKDNIKQKIKQLNKKTKNEESEKDIED